MLWDFVTAGGELPYSAMLAYGSRVSLSLFLTPLDAAADPPVLPASHPTMVKCKEGHVKEKQKQHYLQELHYLLLL